MSDEYGDIVYSFRKNASEVVGAGFSTYKGNHYFFIRVFAATLDAPDSIVPTWQGITLPVALLPEICDAVGQIADVMARNKVVKVIQRGKNTQLRIGVTDYKANVLVYIRLFTTGSNKGDMGKSGMSGEKDGQYFATAKGINVSLNKYDELMKMLDSLRRNAEQQQD